MTTLGIQSFVHSLQTVNYRFINSTYNLQKKQNFMLNKMFNNLSLLLSLILCCYEKKNKFVIEIFSFGNKKLVTLHTNIVLNT